MSLVLSDGDLIKTAKSYMRNTYQKLKSHSRLAGKAFLRNTRETFCLEDFLSVTFLPFTHTIYTLITHKSMRDHLERKTIDRFSTTHTPILLERELLILSEKSL